MRRKTAVRAGLLLVVLAGGGAFAFTHGFGSKTSAPKPSAPTPVPIVAGTVEQHDVPIYLTGVGTVVAYNTDVVRSQIQGRIVSINFTEGQAVHAGDLLAQIDPRPYQAQVDQYTANRDRDQAQLTNAKANLNRYTPLAQKGWATPQLLDTQKAQVAQLEAAVKSDEALIESANVQLSYTRLTSPIDGVTGIRQIDVGNIISPANTNGVVVVTQLEPISLIFTLPETDLPKIEQQGPKGAYAYVVNPDGSVAIRPIKVAQISDGQALIDSGLEANEQVVVDGQYKLQPGTHVTILHGQAAEEATAQSAQQAPIP